MKKFVAITAAIAFITVAACGVLHIVNYIQDELWAWYDAGYDDGILHAIESMEIWTGDRYDPENPDASAWNGYDQQIFINLDGQIYEHGMYQG